jgi:hypothetical protein
MIRCSHFFLQRAQVNTSYRRNLPVDSELYATNQPRFANDLLDRTVDVDH